jgi:hypothetical protein
VKPEDVALAAAGSARIDADTALAVADELVEAPRRAEAEARERVQRTLEGSEQSFLSRLSPKRNPWPELAVFDTRLAQLDGKYEQAGLELQRLATALSETEQADRLRLSEWHAAGGKGGRPEPQAPALREQIEEVNADRQAITQATATVAQDKAAFVSRHRKRLAKQANELVSSSTRRYQELIEELEQTRAAVLEARGAELYAQLFPGPLAVHEPPAALVGGHAAPMRELLGQAVVIQPRSLFELLRRDAQSLPQAASPEQQRLLEGEGAAKGRALWDGSPEAVEAEQAERNAALARLPEWADPTSQWAGGG